jgi:hypothetical protein
MLSDFPPSNEGQDEEKDGKSNEKNEHLAVLSHTKHSLLKEWSLPLAQ